MNHQFQTELNSLLNTKPIPRPNILQRIGKGIKRGFTPTKEPALVRRPFALKSIETKAPPVARELGKFGFSIIEAIPRGLATGVGEYAARFKPKEVNLGFNLKRLGFKGKNYVTASKEMENALKKGENAWEAGLRIVSNKTLDIAFGAALLTDLAKVSASVLAKKPMARVEAQQTLNAMKSKQKEVFARLKDAPLPVREKALAAITNTKTQAERVLRELGKPTPLDKLRLDTSRYLDVISRQTPFGKGYAQRFAKPDIGLRPLPSMARDVVKTATEALPGFRPRPGQPRAVGLSLEELEPVGKRVGKIKIVTDPVGVQKIKNSIIEGQNLLRIGKDSLGKPLTDGDRISIRKAILNSQAKIGEGVKIKPEATITDVTPEGFGPKTETKTLENPEVKKQNVNDQALDRLFNAITKMEEGNINEAKNIITEFEKFRTENNLIPKEKESNAKLDIIEKHYQEIKKILPQELKELIKPEKITKVKTNILQEFFKKKKTPSLEKLGLREKPREITRKEPVLLRERIRAEARGAKLGALGFRKERRRIFNALKNRFNLTDADVSRIRKNRDISIMNDEEFTNFIEQSEKLAGDIEIKRQARIQLEATINEKEFRKVENFQEVLKLPKSINKMTPEQMNKFNEELSKYEKGDEFLPVRMMETINRTELGNAKTIREVLEIGAKKHGVTVEEFAKIKPMEFHKFMSDHALSRTHPFFKHVVQRKNELFLTEEMRIIELSDKYDTLIKKARSSRPRGLLEKLIPTDENVIKYAESSNSEREILIKSMTPEELEAGQFMRNTLFKYYEEEKARAIDGKFATRFVDSYYPGLRRGFLEAWKTDGFLSSFKEMRHQYAQEQKYQNILNDRTGEILAYEKWLGFKQFRSGNLIPTKNSARAFEGYITALGKARFLDQMTPEIMAYVHALSPRKLGPRGLELDTKLKSFMKSWINANKGRKPKGFFEPGGEADFTLNSATILTRVLDLGLNFTTQAVSPVGEAAMNLTMLGPKAYASAKTRLITKQGQRIIKKYRNFTGRTFFDEMSRAANDIGDTLQGGIFALFSVATKGGNNIFLLGKMTEAEFKSGVISIERLAKIRNEMNRYRVVKGAESLMARTTESKAFMQYKSWASPILQATVQNIGSVIKIIKTKGVKAGLSSDEGKQLLYSILIGLGVWFTGKGTYKRLKNKKNRSYVEDLVYKTIRDAMSLVGALDPSLWSSIRIIGFFEDLGVAIKDLLILETYKESGKLKAPREFKRLITPTVARQIAREIKIKEEKEKSTINQGGVDQFQNELDQLLGGNVSSFQKELDQLLK